MSVLDCVLHLTWSIISKTSSTKTLDFFFLRSNKEIGSMFGERSVPPMLSCGVSVIKTGSILIDTLSNISMKYCSNTHFFLCYCCIMTRHFYRYFSGLGECKLSRYLFQKICHVFFYVCDYYFVLFLELHVIWFYFVLN